jgi:signal transduction histidine kinase
MRTLLLELRPTALTERQLSVSLRHLGEALTNRTKLPVDLIVTGELSFPPPPHVKITFYRIAQEAFNNIVKHAQASRITLALHGQENRMELSISDNGIGFKPETILPGHMGVAIMNERVEKIGATLSLKSEPDRGTEVVVVWEKDDQKEGM